MPDLTPEYVKGKQLCKNCRRKMAVRNGMRGRDRFSTSLLQSDLLFFREIEAPTQDLVQLFIRCGAALSLRSPGCMEIRVFEDTWRVELWEDELVLLHNNYEINSDYTRTFTGGFHRQNDFGDKSFHNFTKIMRSYSFQYHREEKMAYDKKVKFLRLQTELAITDNYAVCKKWSPLFSYYIFVDIQDKAKTKRKKHGHYELKTLQSSELGDYSIVLCRVPRWRQNHFIRLMRYLKNKAFCEQRFDYPSVCEEQLEQSVSK